MKIVFEKSLLEKSILKKMEEKMNKYVCKKTFSINKILKNLQE